MRNIFKRSHELTLYKERSEEEEFGRAKKNYLICPDCQAIYFNKSWHHLAAFNSKQGKQRGMLRLAFCPACQMIRDRQYEGTLAIENIPEKFQQELNNLINSYTAKAYEKDCQHRLIAIDKPAKDKWVVTTTENQLANRLAHKIRDVFNKVEVKSAFSKAPDDVERITVNFLPLLNLILQ